MVDVNRLKKLLDSGVFAVVGATCNSPIFEKRGNLFYLNKRLLIREIANRKISTESSVVNFVKRIMDSNNLQYYDFHIEWLKNEAKTLLNKSKNLVHLKNTVILRDSGYDVEVIFGRRLTPEELSILKSSFSTRYYIQDGMGNFTERKLRVFRYDKERRCFRIPYFGVQKLIKISTEVFGFRRVVDNIQWVNRKISPPSKLALRLYKFQSLALNEWARSGFSGVIVVPTGGGKTYIGMFAIACLCVPTLICVTTIELARQWIQKLNEHLGIKACLFGGGKHEIGDVTVAIYNSAAKHIDKLADKFDLAIFDECLTYDTLILTDRGWIPIGEIVENKLPVRVLTHRGRFMPIVGWHKIPLRKRLVKVVLEDGTEIKCTEDHKFLTERGWVEATKLLSRDVLCKFNDGVASTKKKGYVEICEVDRTLCNSRDEIQDFVYDLTVAEDHSYVANGVIVHNCHHVPADSFRKIAFFLKARKRLGLSATPKRIDRNESLIFFSVGRVVYQAKYTDMVKLNLASPIQYRRFYVELTPEEYEQYSQFSDLPSTNPARITKMMKVAFIAEKKYEILKKLIQKLPEDKILVFCQYVDQAKKAYKAVREIVDGQAALLTGSTKSELRKRYFEQFKDGKKRIIVTTTVLDEGIDVPDAETAIILSGSGTERQMIQRIGRVLRYRPNKVAKVIEIITKNTIEERIAERRAEVLREYGLKI